MTDANQLHPHRVLTSWGLWAIICGVVAMTLVFVQMQLLMGQETTPIGQQIGEIAGDIKRSAWRSFLGLAPPEPDPLPPSRTLFDMIYTATPIIAGIAIVLAGVSLLKRENWRMGFYGVALGGGAILFQYLWWMAIIVLGFVLLVKIVENMGDIFSFGG